MGQPLQRANGGYERGFARLMAMVGCVMMITPTAEMAVQIHYHERPQVLLLGGFFLVGVLTVSHALAKRTTSRLAGNPPGMGLRTRHRPGDPLWVPDSPE